MLFYSFKLVVTEAARWIAASLHLPWHVIFVDGPVWSRIHDKCLKLSLIYGGKTLFFINHSFHLSMDALSNDTF